jgi:hypothetical protein
MTPYFLSRSFRPYHMAGTVMGELLMGIFTACFDASGSERDARTPFLTVAGFLSTAEQWATFTELWKKRLADDGLDYFRMVEFAQCVKQFDGWKNEEPRRKKLLGDLVDLIKSHAFRKFGSVVELAALNERLDDVLKTEFHLTAYTLAGRACAGDMRQWAIAEGLTNTRFALVFEDGDLGRGKLRQRLEEDGFGVNLTPKKDTMKNGVLEPALIPLQAADISAYEMSLAAKRENIDRWAATELMRMPGHISIFTAEDVQALNKDLVGITSSESQPHQTLSSPSTMNFADGDSSLISASF